MNNSDRSEKSTDALKDARDEQRSMECFEDDYKPIVTKSFPDITFLKSKGSPASEEDNQTSCISKSEADNDYTIFLNHMSFHCSHHRLESGEESDKGQNMDYSSYSCRECSACDRPSCSWQTSGRTEQDCHSAAQMDSASYMEQEMSDDGHYYSCGKPLPSTHSASDETIVNVPRSTTSDISSDNSSNSYNLCCPIRRPGQHPACYSCHQDYPVQEYTPVPPGMDIDPNTGYPYFCCPAAMGYPGMGINSIQGMQLDQRGRGGQQNEDNNVSSTAVQSSSAEGGANNQGSNGFNMEEFMQKYQKSVQQCYATAQQGLRQTFAANGQPFFGQPSPGNQPYFASSSPGAPTMFASQNQAPPQYYDPNQEAYQGMSAFSPTIDPQQFFSGPGLGIQPFLPPPIGMPPQNIFGNNTGFISDTLHTQTVYSSDYKSFANEGNQFNHFPNGMDIGLGPDSCPSYGPAASPGLAEMGAGGQAYAMGGVGGMNMSSYPLNHMSYGSPYTFDMSSPPSGRPGMSNNGNLL